MKIRRIELHAFALGIVGWVAVACTSSVPEEAVGRVEQAVELHDLNDAYAFSFVPAGRLASGQPLSALRDRLERQTFPVHASGAIHVPLLDAAFRPMSMFGVPVRFTCGATLVSPSYVITAAHCVDSESVRGGSGDRVTLEMYRPTPRLAEIDVWQPRTELTGTFPDYTRVPFAESDGYFVDRYACRLESRCGWGSYQCPSPAIEAGDVALLHCEGRPGDRYGYLDVATNDIPGAEVFLPWKHEVYDVPASEPATADRYLHYVLYPTVPNYWENYHYLGGDKNQLLPLQSVSLPNGTPHRKVGSVTDQVVWTDVLGCHGTSGSGFLQRDADSGAWQFLGPTALGSGNLGGFLCHHNPGVVGQRAAVPGQQSLGYSALVQTQTILAPESADLGRDCIVPRAGHFVLPARMRCEREHSGLSFAPRTAFGDLDPWRAPSARFGAGANPVGEVELVQGRTYRVSVGAVASAGCSEPSPGSSSCPELGVRAGNREVLRAVVATAGQTRGFGALFEAPASGRLLVSVAAQGSSFELGELTLIENGRINAFDTGVERAEVGLVVPAVDPVNVLPMRFVGDGSQGFAALLEAGERLLLTRQAVALRGTYGVRFDGREGSSLRCGLVARSGNVLVSAPCSPGTTHLLEYTGTELPSAVFVELAQATGNVTIDNVRVELLDPLVSSHCEDGARSGDESDIDCGGSCSRCAAGQACVVAGDCVSGLCQAGVCTAAPRCDDGQRNGSETDVDCGGPACADCANGRTCVVAGDCVSGLCQAGVCTAAPQSAGVTATLELVSEWNVGYCANVIVTNRSTTTASGWTVVFDIHQSAIQSIWSTQFTSAGSVYTARPFPWNSQIAPNQSVTFGFCAGKTGANFRPTLTSATSP